MRLRNLLLLAAASAAVHFVPVQAAHACGGFFCNNSQPVNQSAERIIFSHNEDGTVTAVIEIQYSGPSENFAWMLPVAGNPEVAVSSNAAFSGLQNATNPQYLLTTTTEGTCRERDFGPPSSFGFADAGASSFPGADAAAPPPVTVVGEGSVGPYDYVVISVDPETVDTADTAISWLQDNGYDVPDAGADVLRPYLDGGMNLLSFRLSKGNSTGSIRPVRITFGSGLPSIPIRPTAVAAEDDMGVMVFVLGESRAIPANYMSLELNEALINWLSPNATYNDVVTAAANEAGGQGFVTEMAGAAAPLADSVYSSFLRDTWNQLEGGDWTGREGELLNQAINGFGGVDGLRDAVASEVPTPTGVTLDDLLGCVSCYYDWSTADIEEFEPAAFLAELKTQLITPLEETAALFEARPYLTRMYTTMSADEMTMDPVFDFNSELGDYDNVHNADRIIECSPSIERSQAPWRVELPNGDVVRGEGTSWPFTTGEELPANRRILRVGNTGTGDVVTDNVAGIQEALVSHNSTVAGPPIGGLGGGGACSATEIDDSHSGAAALGLALLVALGALRRRRR